MTSGTTSTAEVLVAGAGPVGLMTAIELRRRGVDVLIVESRDEVAPWAKAVGVQPRTLEIFDSVGVAREALDAATSMRGQLSFVNGEPTGRIDLTLPVEVPYRFVALPQYETERVLGEHLTALGTTVTRGTTLQSFAQDDTGVTAVVRGPDGADITVHADYLVGCDGAHSVVRKGLGLTFEGAAFTEEYMLADVEVDWDLPDGYGVRSSHQVDGSTDDLLVCIPLPGRHRYRMSMLVPDHLRTPEAADGISHGLGAGRTPGLHHIQTVLDRLAPQPTTASNMRWSSVFRISHRLVDRYGIGRVFVAGDAAHIHPPTGAQGMNTGIQDAYNLGWKLALAVQDRAAPELLDSYHAERHPIGEEVVGRTVKAARIGVGAGEKLSLETLLLREAQLLLGYPESPLVAEDEGHGFTGGPLPGMRAPDAAGLTQDPMGHPVRLHELLRHPDHTLLLWADSHDAWTASRLVADQVRTASAGAVRCRVVVAADVDLPDVSGTSFRDSGGRLAAAYGFGTTTGEGPMAYLIRPDGYISYRTSALSVDRLHRHLSRTVQL